MASLRAEPPAEIGGIRVSSIDDLLDTGGVLPSSDVLRIHLDDGSRVMVRPSGTEPKLKVYLDTSSSDGTLEERRASATDALVRLEEGVRALIAE
jgi:phosphomannomutase